MNRKRVMSVMLAAFSTVAAFESAFARQGRGHWSAAPPAMRQTPQVSYAGDCGPNPPPGYRRDLKNWRTGFSDRDFSCYILTGPN